MASRKTGSDRVSADKAFKFLGLTRSASLDEISHTYKSRLDEVQRVHADDAAKLLQAADKLYLNYRSAYMSKEGAREEDMLPVTLTGPDSLLEMLGMPEFTQRSMKVHTQQQAQYKDGQLVKRESNRTETFINKEGKREVKVFENDILVKHTVNGKNVLESPRS